MSDLTHDHALYVNLTPGEIANLRYDMQQERMTAAKHVEKLKKVEKILDDYILNNLLVGSTTKAGGSRGGISKQLTTIAVVTDWPAFYTFIAANDAWDLMQKRAAVGALRERWDNETEVPGVERGSAVKVHVSKAS